MIAPTRVSQLAIPMMLAILPLTCLACSSTTRSIAPPTEVGSAPSDTALRQQHQTHVARTETSELEKPAGGIPGEPRVFEDCNRNGIPDSQDTISGVMEDLDGDGEEDMCDLDPQTRDFVFNGWVAMAERAESSYVGVWYQRGKYVTIKYTIPRGMHRATIQIRPLSGREVINLKDTLQKQGAYQLKWIPVMGNGKLAMAGEYVLHAIIANNGYEKPLAWQW